MSTPAVTPEAPAVSRQSEHSTFLPTGKHYRLTGEYEEESPKAPFIEEKPETEPVKEGDSAAPASETAAASEAAPEQEKAPQKTQVTSENRWQKLSRENKELREKLQRLETAPPQRETQQAPPPATETKPAVNAKPKIDDLDPKTGKAKYKDYAEWEEAKDNWLLEEGARKASEGFAKTQREREQQQAQQTVTQEWGKRVETAISKHADYKEVALNPNLPIKQGSVVDVFILDSPVGTEILYELGKNPAELTRINGLSPIAQARELTKLELKVTEPPKPATPPAKPVTQAPPPPRQTSGNGAAAKDAVTEAIEQNDTEAYMREQNARALARRKGK